MAISQTVAALIVAGRSRKASRYWDRSAAPPRRATWHDRLETHGGFAATRYNHLIAAQCLLDQPAEVGLGIVHAVLHVAEV